MSRALEKGDRGAIFCARVDGRVVARQYVRKYTGQRSRVEGWGKTEKAARRALAKNVEELLLASRRAARGTLVTDACHEWLDHVRELVADGERAATTGDTYEYQLNRNLLPLVEGMYLDELTTGAVYQLLSQVRRKSGPGSAKTCRTILSGVCGLMARQDRMERNPVRDLGRMTGRPKRATRALTVDEVEGLLHAFDQSALALRRDLPDLLRFMLATGVRIGEALAVIWVDVDLDGCSVLVDHTIVRVKGVGLLRVPTKTATSERRLALPDWCVEMLSERAQESRWPMVFPSTAGTWRDPNNASSAIRKVRAGTSVDWFVSHTARRTVATMLDVQGLSARAIADQLGHANPSMTQDVYMGRKVASVTAARQLDVALGNATRRAQGEADV